MGRIGYFPSKYVTKLHPGEQPLQVMHTVHVNDGETSIKLLNEQVSLDSKSKHLLLMHAYYFMCIKFIFLPLLNGDSITRLKD